MAGCFTNAIHECLNLLIARYVAWQYQWIVQEGRQLPNILSQPFILIRQEQPSASRIDGIGDPPSDATLVGDAHD